MNEQKGQIQKSTEIKDSLPNSWLLTCLLIISKNKAVSMLFILLAYNPMITKLIRASCYLDIFLQLR